MSRETTIKNLYFYSSLILSFRMICTRILWIYHIRRWKSLITSDRCSSQRARLSLLQHAFWEALSISCHNERAVLTFDTSEDDSDTRLAFNESKSRKRELREFVIPVASRSLFTFSMQPIHGWNWFCQSAFPSSFLCLHWSIEILLTNR